MKKSILSVMFLGFLAFAGMAQGVLNFQTETHDFGTIQEGPLAEYEFEFTNTGDQPIVISSANPSCGCTVPTWTREPIMPGGKGSIKAAYSSQGRPGAFHKSISVNSNANPPTKVLYIKGNVVRMEEIKVHSPEELAKSSKLVLAKNSHNFGKVERGQRVITKISFKNEGKSPLSITSIESSCSCVSMKPMKESVPPGGSGEFEFYYSPRNLNQITDQVFILSNDLNSPKTNLTFSATVVESLAGQNMLKETNQAVPFK